MNSTITFLIVLAVIILLVAWLGNVNAKREKRSLAASLKKNFGTPGTEPLTEEREEQIRQYFLRHQYGMEDLKEKEQPAGAIVKESAGQPSGKGANVSNERLPDERTNGSYGQLFDKDANVSDGRLPKKGANVSTGHLQDEQAERETGAIQQSIDEITWNDLDMSQMYSVMDRACSSSGEEFLYYLLRTPAQSAGQYQISRDQIEALIREPEKRLEMQLILSELGRSDKYSVYSYLDLLEGLGRRSNLSHYLAIILPAVSILLMFLDVRIGIIWLIVFLARNMVSYFRVKREIDPYLATLRYLLRLMRSADKLSRTDFPEFADGLNDLGKSVAAFKGFRRGSFILISSSSGSGNPVDLLFDYIRILFHLDLIRFNSMVRELQGKHRELDHMITLVGRIDAAICLASFKESLPASAYADLSEEGPVFFHAEKLYHPLLQSPVPASINTKRPVLLTGSNASGKSTFLKASALCALLAQTVGFVPAVSYQSRYFRIYSSMSLKDSLLKGESYYMTEIRSIKRILDAGKQTKGTEAEEVKGKRKEKEGGHPVTAPVLCFIDEVLKGTNTIERIAASTEILKSFPRENIFCFAATHDSELTFLLENEYDNYHFEEQIEENDVVFRYKLLPGRASTRNAIRLLQKIGYDQDIVERAEERAEKFTEIGRWEP